MKIVFLDMDGVMNRYGIAYPTEDEERDWPFHMVEPDKIERLNKLTEATGAKIVLSSTWRLGRVGEVFREKAKSKLGIKADVIDYTTNRFKPSDSADRRTLEIDEWLHTHKDKLGVTHWVSLDDLLMDEEATHLAFCNGWEGFTEEVYTKALEWLTN